MAPTTRESDKAHSTRSGKVRKSPGSQNSQNIANVGRKKRPRDSTEKEHGDVSPPLLKKARYAVEILSKPLALTISRPLVLTSRDAKTATEPDPPPPVATKTSQPLNTEPISPISPLSPRKHQEKLHNGLKHELDQLTPGKANLVEANKPRSLRSVKRAPYKSDLSIYFPEYDIIIGNETKEEHALRDTDTPIVIIDSAKVPVKYRSSKVNGHTHDDHAVKEFPDNLFYTTHETVRVDFSSLVAHLEDTLGEEDPLSDGYFELMHRKLEREAKTARKQDIDRAKYEKTELERLLAGLRGHDWLKTLGISGITETKKRDFDYARIHFTKQCEVVLEKFRIWKDEEKRRKALKELAAEEEAEAEEQDRDTASDEENQMSDGDPPDFSDIDASAARQLHEEAARSTSTRVRRSGQRKRYSYVVPDEPEKEFVSFFPKRHLRDAALSRARRTTRSAAAWGHPIPEVSEEDFDLPAEYRDEEILKAHARRRRRDRRVSKQQ